MAGIGHRALLSEDQTAFPTSKTAAAATVTGSMVSTFERTGAGGANVLFSGDTVSGDTLTMKTYVSFTVGDTASSGTWYQVDEDSAVDNGTFAAGGGASYRRFFVPYAPRIRVDAVFDSAATLAASHGLNVDIEALEYDPESKKTVFADIITAGDTEEEGQFTITVNGDTIAWNNPTKVLVWCKVADTSLVGDTGLTINLQGSTDESNWWTLQTLTTASPSGWNDGGDGTYANTYEVVERQDFPLYGRIQITGDSDTRWYTGSGIQFFAVAYE